MDLAARTGEPLFVEEQRFTRRRLGVLLVTLVVAEALVACLLIWGVHQQIVEGRPWGDRPASNAGLLVSAIVTLVLGLGLPLGILLLLRALRLIVEVRAEALCFRYPPLIRSWRQIPVADIASAKARTYAFRDFGGWGIRSSRRAGRAYNVRGNRGVQLVLRDGSKILFGSQRAEELEAALQRARSGRQAAPPPPEQ